MDLNPKDSYEIDDLLAIMEVLRSPEGCPWDREQTHQSIRSCFLEETYEAVEAIDTGDASLLQEELGDVLLQVVFHAQMEKEAGRFCFSDVVDGVAKKMVERHPHVFGDITVQDSSEVLTNWDAIKKRTKNQKSQTDVLKSVSHALPALMRSAKVQQKAEKAGLSPAGDPFEQTNARLCELRSLAQSNDPQACEEKLGDLLFSVVSAARSLGVDSEQALTRACDRFISRFQEMEQQAGGQNQKVPAPSPLEEETLELGSFQMKQEVDSRL